MKMEDVRKKIEKLKSDYDVCVCSNKNVSIKMGILKEIILLYNALQLELVKNCRDCDISQIRLEEDKYFDLYCIYQDGKVLSDKFYFLIKKLVNIRKIEYDMLEFAFDCCCDNLFSLETKFLVLIEKNQLKELERVSNLTSDKFKNILFQYFKDGGEGLISSSTHCLDFEFNLNQLNVHMIDTIDGNPIYFVQDIKDSYFSWCIEEARNYIRKQGFDYVKSPVSKIKKMYFDTNNN